MLTTMVFYLKNLNVNQLKRITSELRLFYLSLEEIITN